MSNDERMRESIALVISESSQTGEARRAALALATRLGFNAIERGKVGIVVTEIAQNLVQHAQRGVLLLRGIEQAAVVGIEVLSLDKGPGMNIEECLPDGFSTAGTSGNGLGAIRRLSGLFEIYSTPQQGSALLAQLWSDAASHPPEGCLEMGVICLPKPGEEVSGDGWANRSDRNRSVLLVVDGLGHGAAAASASSEAIKVFEAQDHRSPHAIIESAHLALRSTRGAALAIAEIDFQQQSVRFAGIGNIAASIDSATEHHNLVSYNGTVGHEGIPTGFLSCTPMDWGLSGGSIAILD
jgi:anti-sigma regulatory factor (Ser/Thr protein kinase)